MMVVNDEYVGDLVSIVEEIFEFNEYEVSVEEGCEMYDRLDSIQLMFSEAIDFLDGVNEDGNVLEHREVQLMYGDTFLIRTKKDLIELMFIALDRVHDLRMLITC